MHTWGLLRNLGDLIVSVRRSREGHPVEQPRPGSGALAVPGSEGRARARYRQAKETKCGGTDGQETEHAVVPTKRGNSPRGPRGGKGVPGHGTGGGKDDGDTEPRDHLNATPPDSRSGARRVPVAQRTHDLRSRMRESRTCGSVGAPGRQLPGATRPGSEKPRISGPSPCHLPSLHRVTP